MATFSKDIIQEKEGDGEGTLIICHAFVCELYCYCMHYAHKAIRQERILALILGFESRVSHDKI